MVYTVQRTNQQEAKWEPNLPFTRWCWCSRQPNRFGLCTLSTRPAQFSFLGVFYLSCKYYRYDMFDPYWKWSRTFQLTIQRNNEHTAYLFKARSLKCKSSESFRLLPSNPFPHLSWHYFLFLRGNPFSSYSCCFYF